MATQVTEQELLYADTPMQLTGVDRDNAIIRGVIMAETGPFKTGRGEFDLQGLQRVQQLAVTHTKGLRCTFKHANLSSGEDRLECFLGRVKNARLSQTSAGVDCVRGDLVLSPTALKSPPGGGGRPYGEYVMELAETDPEALSMSLVLAADKRHRTNAYGKPLVGQNGLAAPPLWHATALKGVDIVSIGDATTSLLDAYQPPDQFDDITADLAAEFPNDDPAELASFVAELFNLDEFGLAFTGPPAPAAKKKKKPPIPGQQAPPPGSAPPDPNAPPAAANPNDPQAKKKAKPDPNDPNADPNAQPDDPNDPDAQQEPDPNDPNAAEEGDEQQKVDKDGNPVDENGDPMDVPAEGSDAEEDAAWCAWLDTTLPVPTGGEQPPWKIWLKKRGIAVPDDGADQQEEDDQEEVIPGAARKDPNAPGGLLDRDQVPPLSAILPANPEDEMLRARYRNSKRKAGL